jgi:hypothetical protein
MGIQIFKNSGASLLSGVLQLATGTELNASLKNVTDQLNTNSPLQLSTIYARITGTGKFGLEVQGSRGAGLYFGDISSTEGGIWSNKLTPTDANYSFYVANTYLGINSPTSAGIYLNIAGSGIGRISPNGIYIGGGALVATAKLQLAAGTATAGTAPIKLTAGVLLSAIEQGTFEYVDGGVNGVLYFTCFVGGVLTRKIVTLV